MAYEPIAKSAAERADANLADHPCARHEFTWAKARSRLAGLPGGCGLNVGFEAVDRHARSERADVVAVRCLDKRDGRQDLTYADLARPTNRFANVLSDLVLKSAGHLIGPFEVESLLMEHPAIAEAGVIGKPDRVAGEVVKAFVSLRPGYPPSDELRLELLAFGRRALGAVAPNEIAFDQHLPHTRSGKVLRRLLKARELGLPEGDLSTLEAVR